MNKTVKAIIATILAAGAISVIGYISTGAVKAYSNSEKLVVINDKQRKTEADIEAVKGDIGEMKGDVKYILKILERMEKRNGP